MRSTARRWRSSGNFHAGVSVASAFRPSLREGASLVSRLWRIAQTRSPGDLHKPSKALAVALHLESPTAFESFAGVIGRPSSRDASASQGLCRSLLASVSAGCQHVTAAAHADEYRRYPVPPIVSFSFELRSSLQRWNGLFGLVIRYLTSSRNCQEMEGGVPSCRGSESRPGNRRRPAEAVRSTVSFESVPHRFGVCEPRAASARGPLSPLRSALPGSPTPAGRPARRRSANRGR